MDERPRPDLDHTREALRQHDERAEESASDEDHVEEPGSDDSDEDEDEDGSETAH